MTKVVSPVGRSLFSVLKEPIGWKGAETNRKYIQLVAIPRVEGAEFIKKLEAESDRLYAEEVEKAAARGKSTRFGRTPLNYKEEGDEITIKFNRREQDGPPVVVDSNGTEVTGPISKDTGVQVALELRPYVMNNTFGVSLKMLAIKTSKLEMTASDAADLFGDSPAPKSAAAKKAPAAKAAVEDVSDLF